MKKHSSTPWVACGRFIGLGNKKPSKTFIAKFYDDDGRIDSIENVEQVVRCVNSHDAMVAALEKCRDGLLAGVGGGNLYEEVVEALALANTDTKEANEVS